MMLNYGKILSTNEKIFKSESNIFTICINFFYVIGTKKFTKIKIKKKEIFFYYFEIENPFFFNCFQFTQSFNALFELINKKKFIYTEDFFSISLPFTCQTKAYKI